MRPVLAALAVVAAPSLALAALPTGARAPDFSTRGAMAGAVVDVHLAAQLKKGPVVLYFFPAAFTGGCNAEAAAFAQAIPDFQAAGATVIGMSADTVDTLTRFSNEKCAGKFTVASAGPAVVKAYGVAMPKPVTLPDGTTRSLTTRTSFVIGRDGRIAFSYTNMSPADHIRLTLDAVRKLATR